MNPSSTPNMDMDMDTTNTNTNTTPPPSLTTTTTTTTRITTTSAPNTSSASSGSATSKAPFKPPVLVLGGTGTVGSRIAAQLAASSHPVVIASRSAPSSPTSSPGSKSKSEENPNIHKVHFDWEDRTTWSNPFTYISSLYGSGKGEDSETKPCDISPYSTTEAERRHLREEKSKQAEEEAQKWKIHSVYLIAPPGVLDAAGVMMDFVDFARRLPESKSESGEEKMEENEQESRKEHEIKAKGGNNINGGGGGVKRFVLQSASCIEPGGPAMGKVHGYFRELGSRGEIEWAVLRPSWFQQNFGVQENHIQSIKNEGKIYSATGDGKIPWISADDIAAVAVQALTMPVAPNTEYLVLGPELLSYDDIASTLTEVLGKKIVHVDLTSGDLERRHRSFGMPEDYSSMMSALDTGIKYGMENRTNDVVLSVTGVAPKRFKEYAESVKHVWSPEDLAGPTTPVDVVWANA